MARRPKANSHDKTIRNVIIGFSVIILIVGALLIWNNRSLSFVATVDGQRLPVEHFFYFRDQAWGELAQFAMGFGMDMNDPMMLDWAIEMGFESLVSFHLTTTHAGQFGLSVNDVDSAAVQERMDFIREWYFDPRWPDHDAIAEMGFTNRSFRQFVELLLLEEKTREHIGSLAVITDEILAEAFQERLEANLAHEIDVQVHHIQTETREEAEALRERVLAGEDILELMREYSLVYDPDAEERFDEFGEIITTININNLHVAGDSEYAEIWLGLNREAGDVSDVIQLFDDTYAFFRVETITDNRDLEQMEIDFNEQHERQLRNDYFFERLAEWAEDIEIVINERVF